MNFEEFLKPAVETPQEATEPEAAVEPEATADIDLDVQKAVVESLAADKAQQDEMIDRLRKDNYELQSEIARLKQELESKDAVIAQQQTALAQVGDVLAKNSETPLSNQLSILDRAEELPDRFSGETREHVLEVIKEARDAAEAAGRLRRAQILEGVLVANEHSGELRRRREGLERLFAENANIVSGAVINELEKQGISYKNGEEYLMPQEILKRTY